MLWKDVFDLIIAIAPYAVAIVVPLYSLKHNRRLKELDLKDIDRGRLFEIEKMVTADSMKAMRGAYLRLSQQATTVLRLRSEGAQKADSSIQNGMEQARNYIDLWYPYFPSSVRDKMQTASSQLACLIRNYGNVGEDLTITVIENALPTIEDAREALVEIISNYNLIDKQKNH